MTLLRIATAAALVTFAGACGPDIPDPNRNGGEENGNGGEIDPIWPAVQDIFSANCGSAGCHAAGSASIVELVGDAAYEQIVEVAAEQVPALLRVEPGDPDYSYLYLKVVGLQEDACNDAGISVDQCGTEMPPPPDPRLSNAELQAIRGWIANGATQEE